MKLVIHFFRHGESQANVVQSSQPFGAVRHLLMLDPTLTDAGIQRCIDAQKDAPCVDLILSSELMRAIQTALYTYPERFVTIVPYLNELGTGLDNVPMCKDVQKEVLGRDYYRLIQHGHPSESSFLEYIKRHIAPMHAAKECLTIALFTHSRLMRKHLNMSLEDLHNNIMVTREYSI